MRGGIPKLSVFCFLFFFCFALLFYLCALFCALLCCVFMYVSLHYVLPALQFNCACLIFMNMYVLLVSVCKCIVYVGSKAHCELMLYCLCLADFK